MASKVKNLALATVVAFATASGAFAGDLHHLPAPQRGGLEVAGLLLFGESSEYNSEYDPAANQVWPNSGVVQGRAAPGLQLVDLPANQVWPNFEVPRSNDDGDDTPHVSDTSRSRSGLDWSGPTPRFLYRVDAYDLNVISIPRAAPRAAPPSYIGPDGDVFLQDGGSTFVR